jgi:tetratricopeptide (TPR) repeat protein
MESHVFCWDKIPGEDDKLLKKYLTTELSIDLLKNEKFINHGNEITANSTKGQLSLKLNETDHEVILKINGQIRVKLKSEKVINVLCVSKLSKLDEAKGYYKEGKLEEAKSAFQAEYDSTNSINCLRSIGMINIEMGKNYEYDARANFAKLIYLIEEEKKEFNLESVDEPEFKLKPDEKKEGVNKEWVNCQLQKALKARTYHDLGYVNIILEAPNYAESEKKLNEAIELIKEIIIEIDTKGSHDIWKIWKNEFIKIESLFLNDLGLCYFEWGKFDNAIEAYDKGLSLKIKPGYLKGYHHFFRGLASKEKNDPIRAKCSLDEARNLFEREINMHNTELKDSLTNGKMEQERKEVAQLELVLASILANISRIEIDFKDYCDAEKGLEEALRLYARNKDYIDSLRKRSKDKEKKNSRTAKILSGILYYEWGRYDEAEMYLNDPELKDSALASNTLGCIYFKKGNKEKAKNCFQFSKKQANIQHNESLKIIAKNNLKLINTGLNKPGSFDWWEWWFHSERKGRCAIGTCLISLLIISILVELVLVGLVSLDIMHAENTTEITILETTPGQLPLIKNSSEKMNTTESISNASYENTGIKQTNTVIINKESETAYTPKSTTIRHTYKSTMNSEILLLLDALILVILILPWIKSFSAGMLKMEFKDIQPTIETRGSSPAVAYSTGE